MVMKFLPHIQNCRANKKCQKIEKIILGTFLKYFSKIGVLRLRFADFRKIFQQFFWHFYTREAILYV